MPPTPRGKKRHRENAGHARLVNAGAILERHFMEEDATEIQKLQNLNSHLEKHLEDLKSEFENNKNLLVEANLRVNVLDDQITVLREQNNQLSSELSDNKALHEEKVAAFQKNINELYERIGELSLETPTGGKALKQYETVKSRETKKCRYDRVIQLISKLVGPLKVDAFLQDFMQIADADPNRMFTMKLSPWDSFFAVVKYQLSDGFLKDFKSLTKERLHIDVFASRNKINEVKNEFSASKYYDFELKSVPKPSRTGKEIMTETAVVKANNAKELLSRRLEILSRYDRLKFDEGTKGNIVIGVGADKGADTTKLGLILENVDFPNDPHGILLVALYTGNDSHEMMRENFSSVLQQIDELETISYFDGEQQVERRVVKKLLGDCKSISAMYGHSGQNSKMPCYLCSIPWSTHGREKALLKNFDFVKCGILRTLAHFKKTGIPLINIDPANAGPPGIHTILGIVQYYVVNWLIALAIKIDTQSSSPANLPDLRKKLKELDSEVETLQSIINSKETCLETMGKVRTSLEKLCKRAPAKPVLQSRSCSSSCCVLQFSKKATFSKSELFRCRTCQKEFHDVCAFLVTEEDRFHINKSTALCLSCQHQKQVTSDLLLQIIRSSIDSMELEIQQHEDLLLLTETERQKLESHLKGSVGSTRQQLEIVMRSIGCDNRIWYQELTGNQVRKLLRPGSISRVLAVFTVNSPIKLSIEEEKSIELMRLVMEDLSFIMTHASSSVKNDDEIEKIEEAVERFAVNLQNAQPEATVTPKLHLLCAHLIPFLKLHRSWARVTEQGIESLHAVINSLNVRYASVQNPLHRAILIVDRMAHFNLIFDVGSSWFRE